MDGVLRVWFVAVSLIYVCMAGWLTAEFVDVSYQLWELRPSPVSHRTDSLLYRVAGVGAGALVIVLQALRVVQSLRRTTSDPYVLTYRELFYAGIQWNLQAKWLILLSTILGLLELRHLLVV